MRTKGIIRTQAQIQAGKTDGITLDKERLKKAMSENGIEIASAVTSYANTVHNGELAGKVKFTKSGLMRSRDTETAGLFQNIRAAATANLAALADYAVTAADLTDLAQKISACETAVAPNPANARVSKKTATENIKSEVAEFDKILNDRMDPLIRKFAATSPAFVSEYKNARNIVDGGGGPRTPSPTPPSPIAPTRPPA